MSVFVKLLDFVKPTALFFSCVIISFFVIQGFAADYLRSQHGEAFFYLGIFFGTVALSVVLHGFFECVVSNLGKFHTKIVTVLRFRAYLNERHEKVNPASLFVLSSFLIKMNRILHHPYDEGIGDLKDRGFVSKLGLERYQMPSFLWNYFRRNWSEETISRMLIERGREDIERDSTDPLRRYQLLRNSRAMKKSRSGFLSTFRNSLQD